MESAGGDAGGSEEIAGRGASDRTLALLAIATLALWIEVARVWAGEGATLYPPGLLGITWYALALLGFAWVFSRCSVPRVSYRWALTWVFPWALYAVAANAVLGTFAPTTMVRWLPLVLGAPAFALFVFALRRRQRRLLPLTLLICALYFVSLNELSLRLYVDASPWMAEAPAEAQASEAILDDRVFYEQGARVDAAVAALAAREPNEANVFFLGFAGFGDQRVFAEEATFAENVVGRRYGAQSRAITLVNDRRDVTSHPLATVWNLERALRGIATRMNVEEDVLFLVLTSHGDEEGLAVVHGAMPLEQLDGATLRDALDAAGIRWRVIVISACHAGTFIPALHDDRTLVVTASAAERTSFGCSDDRDLTYFGEAFFRDALPGATDLQTAFSVARTAIAEREVVEGVEASDPQIDVGTLIDAKWRALERRLR